MELAVCCVEGSLRARTRPTQHQLLAFLGDCPVGRCAQYGFQRVGGVQQRLDLPGAIDVGGDPGRPRREKPGRRDLDVGVLAVGPAGETPDQGQPQRLVRGVRAGGAIANPTASLMVTMRASRACW